MSSSSDNTSMMTYDEYIDRLQIPYEEIASATNNFADENLITQGKTGVKLYKGQLSQSGQLIKIVAGHYPLPNACIYELAISYLMTKRVDHRNIASVFKFSVIPNDNEGGILISKYVANGSLNKYLSDSQTFTWMQRLHICVDVAQALSYLHNNITEGTTGSNSFSIIHGNIKSSKILLDDNWKPKLSGFGYSILGIRGDTHMPSEYYDISAYTDPVYLDTKSLSHKSDVFSFGVVLFEVLFGREASSAQPNEGDNWYFVRLARQHHEEKTLNIMIDPDLRKQMDLQSLNQFSEIAYFCLKEVQSQRPDIDQVFRKLEKALQVQQKNDQGQDYSTPALVERRISSHLKENNKDDSRISLRDIAMATQNFHDDNCIGSGGFGKVYKGKVPKGDGFDTIVAKRLDTTRGQGEQQFRNELQILFNYKHENVISLVGYCDEKDEKVIVYEYASRGSLDRHLNDTHLTWKKRLKICIDVASALEFLHGGLTTQATVIHRNIKTENILLNNEWKAKLSDYGLSLTSAINQETDYVIDHALGTPGYKDPLYQRSGLLTLESDIYSFGVVLFEILCGRSTFSIHKHEGQYLPSFIKQRFEKGKHNEVVFEAIKTQIVPKAQTAFQSIAYRCLHDDREQRPTAKEVLKQLKKALEFQEDDSSMGTALVLNDTTSGAHTVKFESSNTYPD